MPAILFPKRRDLVRTVQAALALPDPDGWDGRITWHAIATRLLPAGHAAFRWLEASPSRTAFPGRDAAVKAVQQALKILADGEDGPVTWAHLAETFLGAPAVPVIAEHFHGQFREFTAGRSPNRNAGTNECAGVVFHHACGFWQGTIEWCLKAGTRAGYHVLINTNGERAVLGRDSDRLHHAGESIHRGRSGCNAFMLGMAFLGDTNNGQRRTPPGAALCQAEIDSAIEWLKPRWEKYRWNLDCMTHHRIISPGRKDDLAPDQYARLYAAVRQTFRV